MFVTNGPLPLLLALFPAHLSTCLHPGLTVMPFPKHSRSCARSPFSQTHPRPSCCRVFALGFPVPQLLLPHFVSHRTFTCGQALAGTTLIPQPSCCPHFLDAGVVRSTASLTWTWATASTLSLYPSSPSSPTSFPRSS